MVNNHAFSINRRRRRRRKQDKPPISAHLLLDDRLNGEIGILSEDLFADLFPVRGHRLGIPSSILVQRRGN